MVSALGSRECTRIFRKPYSRWPADRSLHGSLVGWPIKECRSVVYSIGHLGQQVRDYVGDGSQWGVTVTYTEERHELRGTAGAIRLAIDADLLDPEFFIFYGDSYLTVNLADVVSAFRQTSAPALMTVYRNDGRWETSNAVLEEGFVVLYEKGLNNPPQTMRWVDYGLSLVRREIMLELVPPDRVSDLADVYRTLSRRGDLAGHEVTERFYEIGSPSGLAALEDFLSALPPE